MTTPAADSAEAALAARDNATWCQAMCRAHGLRGQFDGVAWTSPVRPPPLYPDAVTLARGVAAAQLLGRIDNGAGCSVKDSFADVDLSGHGFRVLFEARWIHRPAGTRPPSPDRTPGSSGQPVAWEAVTDPDVLAGWGEAWRGASGPVGLFRAALLADPAVEVLAARIGGRVAAGAVLSLAGDAVGVSNVFVGEPWLGGRAGSPWPGLLAAVDERHPGLPVVGYERPDGLGEALRYGFRAVGPLRVWLRES